MMRIPDAYEPELTLWPRYEELRMQRTAAGPFQSRPGK